MHQNTLINIILSLAGFIGFLLSGFIYYKKIRKHPIICPLRSNCHVVINSTYATVFGIPIEVLGMAYYAFIVISHLGLIIFPEIVDPFVIYFGIFISFGAFCFSLYLIYVQALILKEWCVWCMISAFLSTLIFIITILFFQAIPFAIQ